MKTFHAQVQSVPQEEVPVESVCGLYQRVFDAGYFDQLSRDLGMKEGKKVFSWKVIGYGMILQRLGSKGTLNALMSDLIPVLSEFSDHRRVKENTVSANPGGFSRARGGMPMCVVEKIFDHLFESLQLEQRCQPDGRAIFVLDGSTLTLESTPELIAAYPPARNQHGISHWPILRIVVAHDLRTGMASRPVWGPTSASEQVLADELIARLPKGSVLVGDSNFGIFATAYRGVQTGHPVLLRLTEARAQAIAGVGMNCGTDRMVVWKSSKSDRKSHPALPDEAQIMGRLIVQRIQQNGKQTKLYLFTTLEAPVDEIVMIYRGRWNIETDLRSLKRTVRLHALSSRTPAMVAKELVWGVAAYNLVHVLIQMAAHNAGLEPRELSFSYAQDHVYAALPALLISSSSVELRDTLQQLLRRIASCKLPKRKKKRTYQRKIWLRRRSFPTYPTKRTANDQD